MMMDVCIIYYSLSHHLVAIINHIFEHTIEPTFSPEHFLLYYSVHQCRRINSPLLVVTTHRGQMFPKIEAKDEFNNKVVHCISSFRSYSVIYGANTNQWGVSNFLL